MSAPRSALICRLERGRIIDLAEASALSFDLELSLEGVDLSREMRPTKAGRSVSLANRDHAAWQFLVNSAVEPRH